uniref:Uncharacterized protein n=2 Tax=Guillardia theta TaxID=55529 RepID=A0A7S4PFY4_GUITH
MHIHRPGVYDRKSVRGARMVEESADGEAGSPKEGKSALVLTWFYAAPKELELVKRIYKRKGYTNVVIQESLVKEIATPRGWYRTYQRFLGETNEAKDLREKLSQNFDIVHCMSGGFLNLGLVIMGMEAAGAPFSFKCLVLDSTPIMPQPKAFVRFARAYMQDHGLELVNKVLPEPVHTAFQTTRWSLGGAYVRAKHKWRTDKKLRTIGKLPEDTVEDFEEWTRWASHTAMLNRYDNMTSVHIATVFNTPSTGLKECIFMYNPHDPYLNPEDVERCIQDCKGFGIRTTIKHTDNKHIETLFRKPNVMFDTVDEALQRSAAVTL